LKFNSLKTKVLLWFASVIIIILSVFSFLLNHFIQESINLKIQNNLYYSAKDMHDEIMEDKLDAINFVYEKQNGIDAAIIKENYIIKQSNHFELDNYHHYTFKDDIFFLKETGFDTVDAIYVLNFTEPYSGSIVLTKKGLPNKAEEIEAILLILNPLLFFIIFLVGVKFVDKILHPIKQLSEHTKQINIDNFNHLIDITDKEDEIAELVLTYNAMILRLQEGVEKMDRFNNDISHELRTPLTVIHTQIELALKKQRDLEYYKNSLNTISKESKKIENLVHDMLLLTKYSKENIASTYTL
jgi:methyl-accepting chemotaxis protein